ncbi:MAG: transcription-repair coupling factor [Chloroflexi bacterium]|nr:transcription-repair coupling factor [Chloroflexota bacterium]MDK1044092.1 transcription-repair coupling factor [Anaerolineales bacterium]MCI0772587.1 transcription-repair coupling factor [Chloroflexota bacterium]MCI0805474.1 transcription-repair coupling factor [Chloroflexota bacterium]MCI0826165.1 transcription-repair coupling factor [Chloroflexota bacterium]
MDLSSLLPALRASVDALEGVSGGMLPLPSSARAPIAASLISERAGPLLMVAPRGDRVLTLAQELPHWAPQARVAVFPEPDPLFYEPQPWGKRTRQQRAEILARLSSENELENTIYLATVRAIMTVTPSPEQMRASSRKLESHQTVEMQELLKFLVGIGYEPASIVTTRGQFSRRGGILDIWSNTHNNPVRIELFGDEIETMREFDPATQRSSQMIDNLLLTPPREGIPALLVHAPEHDSDLHEFYLPGIHPDPHGFLDYLPQDSLVLMDGWTAVETVAHELEAQALELRERMEDGGKEAPRPYLTIDELREGLDRLTSVDLGLSGQTAGETPPAVSAGQRFGGQIKPFMAYLRERRLAHETSIVVSRQANRLADLWNERDPSRPVAEAVPDELVPGEITFIQGALEEGWTLLRPAEASIHLITDAEIFGWSRPRPRRRVRPQVPAPESAFADLELGNHVVHVDHGVGRFEGLVSRTLDSLEREYLLISYADGDQLYVPIHQADRVTRYLGVDGSSPRLSRLGSQRWVRSRADAKHAVEEVAQDLLKLYALRVTVAGHAFAEDTPWQRELEASFPHVDTPDQITALEAVKADMERGRPMDRLICGDVGYGKTEVALRAAFKAVMDGTQVGILVPTTVLAQQHYHTFKRRLAAFPVEVEMLSRFRTRAETATILERLREGQVDIVIATHRLLQKDVRFKNLGLLIIDEEQRFGVTHKEYLKSMRTEVDVLTLTATPIPRTLYLALTGVRDISTIDTAPEDRLPVVTHTGSYDPALVRRAVLRELDRGGQVFFVHNRVRSINGIKARILNLIPEAKVEVAHGQMPEKELANVMSSFTDGEVDVLLTTSIIESGLDIPNANTLIVDRADQFGLGQLYQLRGRVGRSAQRAYAYFFHHSQATPEALQRLEIISENSQLGAGYSIALRDLEMRGAGDLLGKRQHGNIAAVGFHFYTQLLGEAVRRLRDEKEASDIPDLPTEALPLQISIELPLSGALTANYVSDRSLRLQLYRRMAGLRTLEQVEAMRSELEDRFGSPPTEVENLLYQLRVKILASEAGMTAISTELGQILIQFEPGRRPEGDLGPEIRMSKRGLWLTSANWQDSLMALLQNLILQPA